MTPRKTKVAIIGSGNIGTDLMIKILRLSDTLEVAAMVGIDPASDGLARAARFKVPTTHEGVDGLIAMEHFDERLDKYLASDVTGIILPEYVGPWPSGEDVPGHFFRAYFIDTGAFQLLGHQYPMQTVADEIVRVHNLLIQFRENGGRFAQVADHESTST